MKLEGRRVLVAQSAYLGDVVLTWPLAWRAHLASGQRVGFLLRPEYASLLEAAHEAVEPIPFDKHGRDRGIGGLVRLARSLKDRFDVALSPHPSFRTALLLRLARIPVRVGFSTAQGAFLYNVRVERNRDKHEVERQGMLLDAAGGSVFDVPPIPISDEQAERARELLRSENISDDDVLVGINPFSVWLTKRWPLEYWAELAELIRARLGARVVVIGGPSDLTEAARLGQVAGAGIVSLVGRTDLGTLNALAERMSAFVSNDSGPAHIAAMRGIPTIVVFGSTTTDLGYVPVGPRVEVVEIELDCRPCGQHGHRRCPEEHFRCMRDIKPEAVFAALEKRLGS